MDEKTIKVEVREVYGVERIYPLTYTDEIVTLTGNKTLSRTHVEALKKMGFAFTIVSNKSL
jgi:hypothetical protein